MAPTKCTLSVVIPAYNEEKRIGQPLESIVQYLDNRKFRFKKFTYEIIVVDGGSKDSTSTIVEDYATKHRCVKLISYDECQGKGAAVKKGMKHAQGKLLLMVDADGAINIESLEALEEKIKGTKLMVVFGSRKLQEQSQRIWYRRILSEGFSLLSKLAIGEHDIKDTQCGFKLFTRQAAKKLFPNLSTTGWSFDVELVGLCKILGIPIVEVAVDFQDIPGSKLTVRSIIQMFLELFDIGYKLRHPNLIK